MMRWSAFLLLAFALLIVACDSASTTIDQQPASLNSETPDGPTPTPPQTTGASLEDRLQAWSTAAIAGLTLVGFLFLLWPIILERRRQRKEVGPYIRVDLATPEVGLKADNSTQPKWTTDFTPPKEIAYTLGVVLETLGGAPDDGPVIAMYFRNQQGHDLGFAIGIGAEVKIECEDSTGESKPDLLLRPRIAYLEPNQCVQLNLVRFPEDWQVTASLKGIEYRDLYSNAESTKHGRWTCTYKDFEFNSTPKSVPHKRWYQGPRKLVTALVSPIYKLLWE